ncbi:hypothetical protein [Flavobacterium sp. FlaQc-47]|uniref:hypothetical protein n=1 Tax=Flavobacterium sp. FlaQc-47 TaxID=3374180 RepID=UPI003756FF41
MRKKHSKKKILFLQFPQLNDLPEIAVLTHLNTKSSSVWLAVSMAHAVFDNVLKVQFR